MKKRVLSLSRECALITLRISLSFVIILSVAVKGHAQTYVSGNISGVWTKANSPYIIRDGSVTVPRGETLTIQPGVEVRCSMSNTFDIEGTLKAEGSIADSIRFVGIPYEFVPGSVYGGNLYFTPSSANSVLKYVATDKWGNLSSSIASVYISTSSIEISNCNIRNTPGLAIFIDNNHKPDIRSNTFDLAMPAVSGNVNGYSNVADNKNAALTIRNLLPVIDNTVLSRQGAGSYYLLSEGGFTIEQNGTLQIAPGVVIHSKNYDDRITVNGTLTMQGTQTDSICLIGFVNNDRPNSIYGGSIYVSSTATSVVMDYVSINRWGGNAAIEVNSSFFNMQHSTVRNSEGAGIYNMAASPEISNTSLYNNATGLLSGAGKPLLTNCKIYNNSAFGINNTANGTADTVDARSCFWGACTGPLHLTLNPGGKGNKVSDKVKFIPWTGRSTAQEQSINFPVSASGPLTFCEGDSVILTADSAYYYWWSTSATTRSIVVKSSGKYTVITSGEELCPDTSAVTNVTVNPLPAATISVSDTVFRKGSSVVLKANTGNNLSYKWELNGGIITGATSASYTASQSGVYRVYVANASCTAVSAPVSLHERFSLPADNYLITITDESCKTSDNGAIRILAKEKLDYSISISDNGNYAFTTEKEISNLSAGSYQICVTVKAQTDYEQCFDVVIREPADLSVYVIVNNGLRQMEVQLQGGRRYTIQLNGSEYVTDQQQITLPLQAGMNRLGVTTEKDCQGRYEQVINLSGEKIYPNPFDKTIHIKLKENAGKNLKVEIRDMAGHLVYIQQFKNGQDKITLHLPELNQGMYILHIKSDKLESVYKVIRL